MIKQMGHIYTKSNNQKSINHRVKKEEEENFLRTLDKGITRLEKMMANEESAVLDGVAVF